MRIALPLLPVEVEVVVRRRRGGSFRFSIRGLMIAVAAMAVLSFAADSGPRSGRYRRLADRHSQQARSCRFTEEQSRVTAQRLDSEAKLALDDAANAEARGAPAEAARARARARGLAAMASRTRDFLPGIARRTAHHEALYHKYADAASHPLRPIWSDPPEP